DIGASLEFVPMDIERFDEQLNQGQIDIAMSGLLMSPYRLEQVRFVPYVEQTFGIVMPDERRNEFDTVQEVVSRSGLAVALVGDEFFRQRLVDRLPDARVTLLDSVDEFTAQRGEYDIMITTAESGSAWTLLHPEYAVVVPSDMQLRLPTGYAVAVDQEELARFLSGWVTLHQANGRLDGLYDHWVLGVDAKPRQPRWSVIRDVLGWVE
ncbi:MAG: transporter substrate-binding domain-containing protein, partial [Gemmatimonadetes bacterium]|nr:transporter substrate-binding domain-containing protein [Gemmatimonadota bacterium]